MKLSEAYVEDRRRIREKLNQDVRALEKSRTRAQKALSDATQTQMNHLITKVRCRGIVVFYVSARRNMYFSFICLDGRARALFYLQRWPIVHEHYGMTLSTIMINILTNAFALV